MSVPKRSWLAGENEELYHLLFLEAQEGIVITTPEGEFLDANPTAEEIFGYSWEELRSMDTNELYADPDERRDVVEELEETGALRGREIRICRAGGEEIICQMWTTRARGLLGEPEVYISYFHDNTQRKRDEEVLKESEDKFRTLAERALVGITLIQGGAYEYVNPAMAEMTGYSREELIGASPKLSVHPEDWPEVERQIERRLEGETQEVRYETRILTKSGETRHVEVAGSRITYQGEPALIATAQDVTEWRRLQREVLQVQETERRHIGQELHDGITSQLTAARLMLSNVSDRVEEETIAARIQRSQEIIEQSADEMRRLSHGLSPGGLSEGDLPAALDGLAQSVSEARFEVLFEEGNSPEESDLEGETGGERRHPSDLEEETTMHLYRIAQEAVSNAHLHGEAEDIVIRLGEEEGAVLLEVDDDGQGFDVDSLDKSASLGLRSMRRRAELIGADLSVESSRGEGTAVRCRLSL